MDTFWTLLLSVVGVLVFALAALGLFIFILKMKNRPTGPTTTNPANRWSPQKTIGALKPHLSGTFGVCVLVILFGAACLLYAVPGSAGYLWWITPILIAVTFLIVKVSNTVKNEFARGIIYVVILIVAGTVILPRLPGSTPARPIPYTTNQMNELADLRRACPGEKVVYNYLNTYQVVNRSQCIMHFWTGQENEIYIQDAQGNEHGPYCERPSGCVTAKIDYEIRAVRSARRPFVGHIKKDPDYKTLSFYYSPG